MKDKYIVYSIVLILLGISLCISSYIIKIYKDKREIDSVENARKIVDNLKKTKDENDILLARDALLTMKDKDEREKLLSIVDDIYLSVSKENILLSYKEILNNIDNINDLSKIKSEIETISYSDIKDTLLDYIKERNKELEEVILKEEELNRNLQIQNVKNSASVLETLNGKVTAFTPFCSDGCNGYLANGMYVGNGNIYYNDSEYGTVRIVAADKSYPFGTIVRIKNLWYFNEDVYAIVLDRGGAIGKNKRALFDLLFEYENLANTFGVENATCEILRYGY